MIQNEKEMRYRMKREKGNIRLNERNLERNIMKKGKKEGERKIYILKRANGYKERKKNRGLERCQW